MLGIAVRKEHPATLAQMAGRLAMMFAKAKVIAGAKSDFHTEVIPLVGSVQQCGGRA